MVCPRNDQSTSLRPLLLALLLITEPLGSAFAQSTETDRPRSRRIDEIIVTAQKREQSVLDVPASLSVLDAAAVNDNASISNVQDLSTLVPSLTFTNASTEGNQSFRIRGIGTEVFSDSVEPAVSIVVDDVVLSRQAQATFDLIDIERVEVLKGPQGTLFGKNASAGVIHLVTRDPSEELEVIGDVLWSPEDDERRFRVGVSGPLSENLSARVSAFYKNLDDWAENAFGGKINGVENWGMRGKLLYEPTDGFRLLFIADHREARQNCCTLQYRSSSNQTLLDTLAPIVPSRTNRSVNENVPVSSDVDTWGLSLRADIEIPGHTITSITAFRDWVQTDFGSFDGLPAEQVPGLILLTQGSERAHHTLTQEVRIASDQEGPVEYLAGIFYFDAEVDRIFNRSVSLSGPVADVVFGNDVRTLNVGVFGQATWHLLDRIHLTGGVRYIHEEVEFDYFRENADGILGGNIETGGSADDDDVTGTASIQIDLTDRSMAYFRYARGYKGLGFDLTSGLDEMTVARGPVDPETSDALELGFKGSWLDGRLYTGIAAFWTFYDGYQSQSIDAANQELLLLNAGKVESVGVELDATFEILPDWTLTAGFAWVDTEFASDFSFDCFAGQTAEQGCNDGQQDLKGNRLPNSPEFKITLATQYRHPLPFGDLDGVIAANGVWQDAVRFSLDNDPVSEQPSYGIANLTLGVAHPEGLYSANLFINNVFDQSFASLILPDIANGSPSGGDALQVITRQAERIVGVRVSFAF